MAAFERRPLTVPSPPKSFAAMLPFYAVGNQANELEERGHPFFRFPWNKSNPKMHLPNASVLRSPGGTSDSAGPPMIRFGGPALRWSYPTISQTGHRAWFLCAAMAIITLCRSLPAFLRYGVPPESFNDVELAPCTWLPCASTRWSFVRQFLWSDSGGRFSGNAPLDAESRNGRHRRIVAA